MVDDLAKSVQKRWLSGSHILGSAVNGQTLYRASPDDFVNQLERS
jgi:hypothetical protein